MNEEPVIKIRRGWRNCSSARNDSVALSSRVVYGKNAIIPKRTKKSMSLRAKEQGMKKNSSRHGAKQSPP
ncbi:hypothetical protein JXO59_14435, partial [candidate division KSB1 bacterium]|nr:hypothetical protein [candidate division KSB1 bacterium]